ncbi:MAG: EamA/RhaT family transporter, partial [Muribaculaceae bacterium]|nr:EamA/RhaT family transporter [Muribaculaceae bacterium]
MKKEKIAGHSAMMGAEIMWGLGAPLGKIVLAGSVTPLLLTDFRILGAGLLFWILSFFVEEPKVPARDHLALFGASLLAIV